jgi:hypothetical protein
MMLAINGMMMILLRCRAIAWQEYGNNMTRAWQGHGGAKRKEEDEVK